MSKREIKFRAWDEDRKIMIHHFNPDQNAGRSELLQTDEGNIFCGGTQKNGDWQEPTLMQYTGLKDKNGKEIYEGDVLEWKSNPDWHSEVYGIYVVKYGEIHLWSDQSYATSIGFYVNKIGSERQSGINHLTNHKGIKVEVIGNIYSNPELLKH